MYGFLYVLTNPSMPGLAKVGQSEKHPASRATELSNHTGIPTPFGVAFYIEVTNRVEAEQRVHSALKGCRVSSQREFFRTSPEEVLGVIHDVAGELIVPSSAQLAAETEGTNVSRCPKCQAKEIQDAFHMYLKCTSCGHIRPLTTLP